MAKLPDATSIGRVAAPSQTPGITVGKIDYSPMAEGGKAIAAGVQSVSAMASRYGEKIQEADDFATQEALVNWKLDREKEFEDAQRNMPVGGGDFAASWDKNYSASAKEFMKSVPPQLRPKYDLALVEYNARLSKAAGTAQNNAADTYEKDRLETTLGRLTGAAEGDADRGDEFAKEGFGLIEGSRLSPVMKERARQAFEERVVGSRVQGLIKAGRTDEATALAREFDARRPQVPVASVNAKERVASITNRPELATAIRAGAAELGIPAEDLATVISYETGGKFSTSIRGGAGNRHIGLIQFGEEEQRTYGARQGQSPAEQMKAVVAYLKDRGLKPGMGLLDLYSTINAGSPGRYNASDANNGGAPGSVRDKVENQMGGHRDMAYALLGPDGPAPAAAPAAAAARGAGVAPVAGDDPAKLRAEADAYDKTNPEAARQLRARAAAAEKGAAAATDGSPAADGTVAPAGATTPATAATVPARPPMGPAEMKAKEFADKWGKQQSAAVGETYERVIIDGLAGKAPLPDRAVIERDPRLAEPTRNALLRQHDAAAQTQRVKEVDQIQFQAARGQYTTQDADRDFEAKRFKSFEEYKSVHNLAKEYEKEAGSAQRIMTKLQGGEVLNPRDKDDKAGLEALDKQTGINARLQKLDPVAQSTAILNFAATGMVADTQKGIYEGIIRSGTPQQIEFAMTTLDQMYQRNPASFVDAFGKDVYGNLQAWQSRVDRNPAVFREWLTRATDPAHQKAREELDKSARKVIGTASDGDIMGRFDAGFLSAEPNKPVTTDRYPGMGILKQEYADAFSEGYVKNGGDEKKAHEFATNLLKQSWADSKLGGNKLMKYAPETLLPPVGGSFDWAQKQIDEALSKVTGAGRPGSGDTVIGRIQSSPIGQAEASLFGRKPEYSLVPTPETKAEIDALRSGRGLPDGRLSPAWTIVYMDKTTGELKTAGRFYFDVKAARDANVGGLKEKQAGAEAGQERRAQVYERAREVQRSQQPAR